MSWYVLEGPDQTGKTTLAQRLQARGWRYEHATAEDRMPILAQRMAQLQDEENVVWDRAHLGELVHGPLDRGYQPSQGWARLIDAFLLEREAHAVLLLRRPGPPEGWENDAFRHTQLAGLFQEAAIQSLVRWGPSPVMTSRYPEPSTPNGSFKLDRIDPEGLGGLGTTNEALPVVWVLGEQQNPNAEVPWPFATRCGLELVWPDIVSNVRVSNAYPSAWRGRVNATRDLRERWRMLGRPAVVALGDQTAKACRQAEVPVSAKLPHPQWHLRFHAHEGETYRYHLGMAILNAMRAA